MTKRIKKPSLDHTVLRDQIREYLARRHYLVLEALRWRDPERIGQAMHSHTW